MSSSLSDAARRQDQRGSNRTGSVLVVGAGIGGMQASLDLASAGFKVYLAEKDPAIGGVMSQLDKTFPTNDCAMCTMAPRLVEIGRHKDIEIITLADLEDVRGEPGNFTVTLRKRARFVNEETCTGCGECAEACPIEVPSEYNVSLNSTKAVYRRYPQAIPNSFAIRKLGRSPCSAGCPAEQKVQGYVALVRQKRYEDAFRVILRDNPFPSACGRVCNHRCEDNCSRKDLDEAVSIMGIKRFVADWAFDNQIKPHAGVAAGTTAGSGKRVAIVGAGPAGLTAANDLCHAGHEVTVLEALPVAGGMMRVGIPEYRLPRERLEWDIDNILSGGTDAGSTDAGSIELKTDHPVESIRSLRTEGYDAVFIATGTHKGVGLGIPGEDTEGVFDGLEFLRRVNLGQEARLGSEVVVIGGGNTAIDAARTAKRLGARVTILYRRTRAEMPAQEEEIEEALEEGIGIEFLAAPTRALEQNGTLRALECVRMELGEPDESGRRRPLPVAGSEFEVETDTVILAIGQKPELPFSSEGLELTKWGTIDSDPESLLTSMDGVFAGGDVVTGPTFVVDAIAAGHRAAESIDLFLAGRPLDRHKVQPAEVDLSLNEIRQRVTSNDGRHSSPVIPLEARSGFDEVNTGFSEAQALAEAERCLNCGICSECLMCDDVCQVGAVDHNMPAECHVELEVGAVILSPGYELLSANTKLEYGYWQYPNVVAALEFERILSASGPFLGQVLRPSDHKPPKRIAFLQCVASREDKRNYCSSVCCMYATKESIIAKEHIGPDVDCDIYCMDIRAFGKGFEEYTERAKQLGVRYIRCRPSAIEEIDDHRLSIRYMDSDGHTSFEEYDLVVLSMGMGPPKELTDLARHLGVDLDEHGFCRTDPFRPVESSRPGIYVCGPFTEPKDIPETVTQASGAASKAQSLLHEVRGSLITPREFPPEQDITGQRPRIGVFICHCGTNIAGVIDVNAVAGYVRSLPDVVYADNYLYTCSNDAQDKIKDLIAEHSLNRVIVASCTPRTHEPLFRNTIREAGLNPYLFEMANIRDQCSWVHNGQPDEATTKAKDLIRMAVAKSRCLEPLYSVTLSVKSGAVVLGGGIAGMTAAINLADQGFTVALVEREATLGGNMRHVHTALEGSKDPQQELAALIERTNTHENIRLWMESQVVNVDGFVGNFTTTVSHDGAETDIEHGVFIVATGAEASVPTEYLYGEDDRVVTQTQLEERIGDDEFNPKRIVMIQCTGSREDDRMYCSRICCSQAMRNAVRIKESHPKTDIFVLYRDIRTYGFREKYYTRARELGVKFVRYEADRKPVVTNEEERIRVVVHDPILGRDLQIDCDLLALAPAIVPRSDAEEVARMLKVPLTRERFFLEAHMKLRPVDFAVDGVFLAGLAHSPKDAGEAIAQAEAAAGRAAAILSSPEYVPEAIIASVDKDVCAGCGICASICSFEAPEIVTVRGHRYSQINRAVCKGCGACAVACPSGAVQQLGFRPKQISEMIAAAVG